MKRIALLFIFLVICIASYSKCKQKNKCCKKKAANNSSEIWMRYDETKCDNPWHFNWFAKPTEAQLRGAVKGYLQGQEIEILQMNSTYDEGLISCEACNCPNGRHFFVRVHKTETEKLKTLKFYETPQVPEFKSENDVK